MTFKRLTKSLATWISNNKLEFALLVGIVLLASFFRLWRINEYLPFLGDEGRDVRIVRRFVENFHLMFIGPRTSIGDMYLGPLFYYFIAPSLLLFRLSPVGPAVTVALLDVGTVIFIWVAGRNWFGKIAGLTGAFLYAISPLSIDHAKHSWNPNIMPFFALLSIYSIWKVWSKREYKWLLALGISYAFVLQSHYLGLLLLPTIGIFWLAAFWAIRGMKKERKKFLVFSLFAFLLFVFFMSPLFLFDAKHGWHNLQAVLKFFTDRQTTVSVRPWNALVNLWPIWDQEIVTKLLGAGNETIGFFSGLILTLGSIILFFKQEKDKSFGNFILVLVWIGFGVLGLGLYKQTIYDHYYGFSFPAVFLLSGAFLQALWNRKLIWLVALFVFFLAIFNLIKNPLLVSPQRQLQRVQELDQRIIKESFGKPFNFALIAKRNYDEGYLYFFEIWHVPVREIDPQRYEETKTDQLFVVCEDPVCEPINNPKAEIANFGWSKVDKTWNIDGVKLFQLVNSKK